MWPTIVRRIPITQHSLQEIRPHLISRRKWIGDAAWRVDNIVVPHPILWHILSGAAAISVNGERFTGMAGDIVLYKPGSVLFALPDGEPPVLFSVHFEAKMLGGEELTVMAGAANLPKVAEPERLRNLMMDLAHEEDAEALTFPLWVQARLLEILAIIVAGAVGQAESPLIYNRYVLEAVQYIHEQMSTLSDTMQIARAISVSPSHLRSLFYKYLGVSPSRYVKSVRLSLAYTMLADPYETISGIADKLGFNDANYFTRWFRQLTGEPPSSYRKRIVAASHSGL